jgi:chitinase
MGVPFYGRGWGGVPAENDGLGQPFTRLPGDQGSFKYRELGDFIPGMTRYWSEEAQAPWLYNATTQIMISYDDPESLALKAAYAREHGLGGVMIWELGCDDAEHSLLSAVNEGLSGED